MPLSENFVAPEGSETPLIYIVGEAPGHDEDKEGRPFVGESGKLLRNTFPAIGLNMENVRIFNVVPYRPTNEDGYNRTPSPEECAAHIQYLLADIEYCKPKVVLALGGTAASALTGVWDHSVTSMISNHTYKIVGVPIRIAWHPSYVLRQGGANAFNYKKWISQLKEGVACGDPQIIRDIDNPNEMKYQLFQQEEVDEFLANFEDAEYLGYDMEGSSLETLLSDFHLAGIGLAKEGYGAYIRFCSFEDHEWRLTPEIREKIRAFLERKQSKILVFNLCYEVPATLNIFGVECLNLIDVMQYCRVLNMTGGLKEISTVQLGERKWTDEIFEWLSALRKVLVATRMRTRKENTYHDGRWLSIQRDGYEVVLQDLEERNRNAYIEDKEIDLLLLTDEQKKAFKRKYYHLSGPDADLMTGLQHIFSVGTRLNLTKENICNSLTKIIESHHINKTFDPLYTQVPSGLMGHYCARDCWNTLRLYHHVMQILVAKNLTKTASYFNEHNYLSYELQLNGIPWNDERASNIDVIYTGMAIDFLRKFLMLPHVIEILKFNPQNIIDIQAATDVDKLKTYFNPEATDKNARAKFESVLVTKRMKLCMLLGKVKSLVLSGEHVDDRGQQVIPSLQMFLEYVESAGKDLPPVDKRNAKLEALDLLRDSVGPLMEKNTFGSWEMNLLSRFSSWELTSTDQGSMQEMYTNLVTFMGVDIDNERTHTREIRTLLYYRLFKKLMKAKSTYVWGQPGRASVRVVNRNELLEGRVALRTSPYRPKIGADEMYLYCPEFRANTAITKRWTATAHTIPSGSELRDIQESRFVNGILIHFDYSQQEVRVMAALAKEESLLEAFRQGKDVHRFVASQVWKKPEEDVTDQERRFAKLATFSLLYGKTIDGFAEEFMNGDVTAATDLFDKFFAMFPAIKIWIEARHEELRRTGEVTTMWGDKIIIPFDPSKEHELHGAERQAQNYPIQNAASQIAGVSIARISRWIQKAGYKVKPFCFTHDSADMDSPLHQLIEVCHVIPQIAEDEVRNEWNIPVAIDFELGVSGNKLVEFKGVGNKRAITKNEDGSYSIDAKIEGEESAVTALVGRLRQICTDVQVEITKEEAHYTSYKEMFVMKRAYSRDVGNTIMKQKGTIRAEYRVAA